MSREFKISEETLQRCNIIPADSRTLKQFANISTEYLSYLLDAPNEVTFSLYFHVADKLIEFITPKEVSKELLSRILAARDRAWGESDICLRKKDVPAFFAYISAIRSKKIKTAKASVPGLSEKVIEIYETLSGASQLIVKGGIDQEAARQVERAAASLITSQMGSEETLETLSSLILCDPTLYDHSASVAMFAGLIATKYLNKYTKKKGTVNVHNIALGGLYHDVGKTCIPNSILNKPGKLTLEEFEVMKTHTELGYRELLETQGRGVQISDEVILVALEHHEKFTGGGYPHGLSGCEETNPAKGIHLNSRIVTIADVYSALLMKRVYKEAFDPDSALKIMKGLAPTDFDPEIFSVFEEAVSQVTLPENERTKQHSQLTKGRIITFD